ncbi:diguanylate cyclase [Fulvimarina sp. 2208YS6-2-32]|uniref:diguanylate cyclase n=1 Tax=Fulvimarina uroteuthidis TaxID=3098149 RepID=A0ABU5I4T7_9HYPH|nr:diguanylate cyclase [Fulvimarina sp. 2208YS6-2-32]MDY8109176.1 diguanylate cyclase [Fulvimarina sp. 2208YS6-2-32]
MDTYGNTLDRRSARLSSRLQSHAQDLAVSALVERLLAGRTRHIRLEGELRDLFRERTWSQSAKIIRSWMIWVAILNVATIVLNTLMLPQFVTPPSVLALSLVPVAVCGVLFVWRKPRTYRIQCASLVLGMFVILFSIALAGWVSGGTFHERYLSVMLFVATTGIIIFGIPVAYTTAIAALAVALYLTFQLLNPDLDIWGAVSSALFFASGIVAIVVAKRTITILAHKTFLLELRDKQRVAELAQANDRLERLARVDPLTGTANRRWMGEILDALWSAPEGDLSGTAMLMCDVDHFKGLNDRFGHLEGDRCLVEVARILQACVEADRDQVARYGGEEFLVLLRGDDDRRALTVAEDIRRAIEAAAIPNPASSISAHVTVSIGVAVLHSDARDVSPEQLQRQADNALYVAKATGRNRVEFAASALRRPR